MKTRYNFVSNSSSSSFILTSESELHPITTASVAYNMLETVYSDLVDYQDIARDILIAMEWLTYHQDCDAPLHFPWSVNYQTYIWWENGRMKINTSNNHDWNPPGQLMEYIDDTFNIDNLYFIDLANLKLKTAKECKR